MLLPGRPGRRIFTLAGCARLSGSGTGRAWPAGYRAGVGGVAAGRQGRHDLSGLAGVVQPHSSLNAQRGAARGRSRRGSRALAAPEPLCPGWRPRTAPRAPAAAGRAGPAAGAGYGRTRAGRGARVGHQLRHQIAMSGLVLQCPTGAGGGGEVPAVWTDPGSAPSARGGRGSQAQRARAGSGDGRHLPLATPAISAAGVSQRQPVPDPGRTAALPSAPGQCHRAGRPGVYPFCDHRSWPGSLPWPRAAGRPPRARQARTALKTRPREWECRRFPAYCRRAWPGRPGNRGDSSSARLGGGSRWQRSRGQAASQRGAPRTVAGYGGEPGGPGDSHGPCPTALPGRRTSRRVGLLAPWAAAGRGHRCAAAPIARPRCRPRREPPDRHARRRRAHLAPHDRHP